MDLTDAQFVEVELANREVREGKIATDADMLDLWRASAFASVLLNVGWVGRNETHHAKTGGNRSSACRPPEPTTE